MRARPIRGPYVTRGLEDVLLIVCFKSRPPMFMNVLNSLAHTFNIEQSTSPNDM